MKKENGITLVALVVTIVVLIIIAGVTLSLTIDNGGIMKRAKTAVNDYASQDTKEEKYFNDLADWVDKNGKESGMAKVPVNTKATKNGTINGQEPNINNPIIPQGYTPIDAGDAKWGNGSSAPTQDSVDHGLVIKDDAGNEWVWVPVEASVLSSMCVTSNDEIALSGDVGVTTNLYTNSTIIGKTGDTYTLLRSTPNTTDYREPDIVIDRDKDETYYKTILGFDTPKAMAEAFITDYANMISSIKKYGGFYIGRYELSNEGVQKEKATLTNKNWYELYKKCTTLNASDKVESKMIWGIQWDLACDFISKKGEQKSITNSSAWGNYSDSTDPANKGNYEKSKKKDTGSNEYWKANNIYDIAGNCYEWTQEAINANYRAYRGGNYVSDGSDNPASDRGGISPTSSDGDDKRFSSHFNNYYWNLERGNQWKEEWNRLTENRI